MITGFYYYGKDGEASQWQEIDDFANYMWVFTCPTGCSVSFTYSPR